MADEHSAEAVRAHFEADADYWSAIYNSSDDVAGLVYGERLQVALALIDQLRLKADARVADVGAGAGLASVALAARGFSVRAFDSAERMVDLTRERAAREGAQVDAALADAEALPVPDGHFDLVVALGLLPWLEDPSRALREFKRVLAPGGSLLVTADNRWRLVEILDPTLSALTASLRRRIAPRLRAMRGRSTAPFQVRRHSPRDLRRLLHAQGFVNVETVTVGYGPITFMRRPLLQGTTGMWLAERLSHRSARVPLLGEMGVHVVARASAPPASVGAGG